ncbi:Na(+)/H(+) antiporter subunit C, partial [Dietzia sp. DQ11-44]|nr:Na(+)/H(+) antiporter subunit C [Dietzia sp. DQ11-44]
ALAYRSYQFTTADEVADDAEDTKIAKRSPTDAWSAPDRDLSDDHTTGQPTELGDHVDYDDEDLEEAEAEAEAEARARAAAASRDRRRTRRDDGNPDDGKEGGR